MKTEPGFLVHVAYEEPAGFVVAEVWETQEQHDAWFTANVTPNVPFEITQEVVGVHSGPHALQGRSPLPAGSNARQRRGSR